MIRQFQGVKAEILQVLHLLIGEERMFMKVMVGLMLTQLLMRVEDVCCWVDSFR